MSTEKDNLKHVYFRLPPEIHRKLKAHAATEGMSMTDFIIVLVEEDEKKRKPRPFHVREVTRKCIEYAIIGKGPIGERLSIALQELTVLRDDEIPDGILLEKFKDISCRITKVKPVGGEGSIEATLNRMTGIEISELVESLISFYEDVIEEYPF